jgi:NACHT domain
MDMQTVGEETKLKRACTCSVERLAAKTESLQRDFNPSLLKGLQFPTMTHRCMEIVEAHRKTFRWILHDCISPSCDHSTHLARPWSNFAQWLRRDGGIYWVNGKAGSGKSTLMKFISEQPEVVSHIAAWAAGADLHVSHFYFWNSGTILQRSQAGLLRSLLFDVLKDRLQLIQLVFAELWKQTFRETAECNECIYDAKPIQIPDFKSPYFHTKVLEAAFRELAALATSKFKLCFFIDGLDEYDGVPEVLTDLIRGVSPSPFIKFCVSSRPWLIFEEAFESCPSLRMQDMTYTDIQQYCDDKLQASRNMRQLERLNPIGASAIRKSIVSKANGVFLWVRIVTKSIVDGLRNQDSMSDLQRRLEALPSDLDALYNHLIDRINPLYTDQASRIFQIYDTATELNLHPTILELELAVSATHAEATSSSSEPMSDEEVEQCCDRMAAHLKSRCEGLLETHDHLDATWESIDDAEEREHKSDAHNKPVHRFDPALENRLKIFWKVSYLHRTVKDFLKTDAVRAKLQQIAPSSTGFHPNISLLMSYLINLKRSLYTFHLNSEACRLHKVTNDFLSVTTGIDNLNNQLQVLLHEFHNSAFRWWMTSKLPMEDIPTYHIWRTNFLLLTVHLGLWRYVGEELGMVKRVPQSMSSCLLRTALNSRTLRKGTHFPTHPHRLDHRVVSAILRIGADPNDLDFDDEQHCPSHTIWQSFLQQIHSQRYSEAPSGNNQQYRIHVSRILQAMLRHGANPTPCPCEGPPSPNNQNSFTQNPSKISSIIEYVEAASPTEAVALRSCLREVGLSRRAGKRKLEDLQESNSNKYQRLSEQSPPPNTVFCNSLTLCGLPF